jgi:hypothetical protein
VVLGRDPLREDPSSLITIPIEGTMVGGRWVYIDRLFADCLGAILKISGDRQTAPKGSELPDPLVVEVRDSDGNPAPGAQVLWILGGHAGSVSSTSTTTDAERTR